VLYSVWLVMFKKYDLHVTLTYITPWTENYINSRIEMNYRKLWAILSFNIYHTYVGEVFFSLSPITGTFRFVLTYLRAMVINKNFIHEETNSRLNLGDACYHLPQNLLSFRLLSKGIVI
jgi:hypothetical protein